ncbi:serine/threonine protein kinase [Kalmusia sp. IMI 367209]|nr:serine/threonine protein kinase [Kalmusia sp. IMI 367209]
MEGDLSLSQSLGGLRIANPDTDTHPSSPSPPPPPPPPPLQPSAHSAPTEPEDTGRPSSPLSGLDVEFLGIQCE